MDLDVLISESVDIKTLLEKLSFVEEETGPAAREQPMLYLYAARLRVQALRRTEKAKAALKLIRSQKAAKIREEVAGSGERATEGRVGELLTVSKVIQKAEEELRIAEEQEEYTKHILEAYRMRRDALKVVVELLGAEVYVQRRLSGDSTEMSKIQDELLSKYPRTKKKKRRTT